MAIGAQQRLPEIQQHQSARTVSGRFLVLKRCRQCGLGAFVWTTYRSNQLLDLDCQIAAAAS
jgi:hypothetical protein